MVPEPGDVIFVPNVDAGKNPGQPFNECGKRGGYASVARVQTVKENLHFVSITNFGGMEFQWEGFLEDLQEKLKTEIGFKVQAGLI